MEKLKIADLEITMGHQNPWHSEILKLFSGAKALHLDPGIFGLLAKGPNMWAAHSIKFNWGELGLLSITYLDAETGKIDTEFLALPTKPEQSPPPDILSLIINKVEDEIIQGLDKIMAEMDKVLEGEIPSIPFSSTHIVIELIRQDYRDRSPSLN